MSVQKLSSSTTPAHQVNTTEARATWSREQKHLGAACEFPGCDRHAEHGVRMCEYHAMVRLASNGSWVNDTHADGGHG